MMCVGSTCFTRVINVTVSYIGDAIFISTGVRCAISSRLLAEQMDRSMTKVERELSRTDANQYILMPQALVSSLLLDICPWKRTQEYTRDVNKDGRRRLASMKNMSACYATLFVSVSLRTNPTFKRLYNKFSIDF